MFVQGRYPHDPMASVDNKQMAISVRKNSKGDLRIRIDDADNLDFWMEIYVPADKMEVDDE